MKDLLRQMQDSQNNFALALENLYSARFAKPTNGNEQYDTGYAEECKAQF